jgi:hypothetical protein
MDNRRKDLAYWRDVAFIGLGVLSVVASIANISHWHETHDARDIKIALGFLLLLLVLFALHPRRFELLLGILLAIVVLGVVGTILWRSLAALPLIVPCGILVYALLKWKGKQFTGTK